MAEIDLPQDFKDFLRLLNEANVEYLLIGGYAVGYYGYPRTTADIDFWIASTQENASKILSVFREFGMNDPGLTMELLLTPDKVVRMGFPPMRIEVLTGIDGVTFAACYLNKQTVILDQIPINIISLDDLKKNKKASGRHKDLEDLEHLP